MEETSIVQSRVTTWSVGSESGEVYGMSGFLKAF